MFPALLHCFFQPRRFSADVSGDGNRLPLADRSVETWLDRRVGMFIVRGFLGILCRARVERCHSGDVCLRANADNYQMRASPTSHLMLASIRSMAHIPPILVFAFATP